ncbi:bifunctional metallophosphatase/5'-nucleotidase [Aurantiacibacter luteus]|uniref:5'-nucleotidase n=1 Tax=Aurantiacibacter luteus TaxID=1581420 RepID=A0A0G9MZ56_9SPHN|nr:bifunctional metallophosphatase/5'-nucleotidase [Aurantiacibacter luteus]KLE36031.1 hypothetical protein AAW00_02050 [Aurantiacibacter luteus]
MTARLLPILLAASTLSACATAPAAGPVEVQLLAINDFHGNLEVPQSSESWLAEDGTERRERVGGAARLAAALAAQRRTNSLTVAAGDLIGASPLTSALFLDEPSIKALSQMRLDVASVGNHEFDRGTAELRRMQAGGCERFTRRDPCALEPFAGAGFDYLAANVVAEDGTTLFPATAMREVGGARIGFVGMTLEGTPGLVADSATAGFRFLDEAETANRHARELRAAGADAVVVLIHQGGDMEPRFNLGPCPAISGDIGEIVARLDPAIDLVVSGHTHRAYVCEGTNAAGGRVLLTSGGRFGGFLTDIAMVVDPAADRVLSVTARNLPVDGSAGEDADVAGTVAAYVAAAGPVVNRAVGTITGEQVFDPDCGDTPAQDFIADAYLHAGRAALGESVDLALVNSGGVRSQLAGAADGVLSYGELAQMAPFNNGLIVLEITGADLAAAVQQMICDDEICDSVLIPSAGAAIAIGEGRAVLSLDGQPLDPARRYRLVTNSFLAGGGDGFTRLKDARQVANIGFDIEGIEAYAASGPLTVPTCGRVRGTPAADL